MFRPENRKTGFAPALDTSHSDLEAPRSKQKDEGKLQDTFKEIRDIFSENGENNPDFEIAKPSEFSQQPNRSIILEPNRDPIQEKNFIRDHRFFASLDQPLELRTPLASELDQIRRQVYVYGHGGGKNRPLGDAAVSLQTRDQIHRLWEKLRQARENFSNGRDAQTPLQTLEQAQSYLSELFNLANSLEGEERLEFLVLLIREQQAIVAAFNDPILQRNELRNSLNQGLGNRLGTVEELSFTYDEEDFFPLIQRQSQDLLKSFEESLAELPHSFRKIHFRKEVDRLTSKLGPYVSSSLLGSWNDQREEQEKIYGSVDTLKILTEANLSPKRTAARLNYLHELETNHFLAEVPETIQHWIIQAEHEEASTELVLEFVLLAKTIGEVDSSGGITQAQAHEIFTVAIDIWQKLSASEQWELVPWFQSVGQELLLQDSELYFEIRQSLNLLSEKVAEILNDPEVSEDLELNAMDRALAWLLLAEGDSDWQVSLANVQRTYSEAWEELAPLERVQLRQVHSEVLVNLQERWKHNSEAKVELAQASHVLATVWQRELLTDESAELSGEALENYQEARLQAVVGLTVFCHQVKLDSLGNQLDPEQSNAPLHLLERELRTYQKEKLASVELFTHVQPELRERTQAEFTKKVLAASNALLEAGWPYGAVEILEQVPSIDLNGLDSQAKAEFLKQTDLQEIRIGIAGVYTQAQLDLAEQVERFPDIKVSPLSPQVKFWEKSNFEWAFNSAQLRSSETWAEIAGDEPRYSIAQGEVLQIESTSELGRLSLGLSHLAASRSDEALNILMGLIREEESLRDPRVAELVDAIKPQVLALARQRVERGYQLLRAFARSKDGEPIGIGNHEHQIQASTSRMMEWIRSLPLEKLPDSFGQAMELYESEHGQDLGVLRSFIEENEMGVLLQSFDQLDQEKDLQRALSALTPLLELDTNYWQGDGELMNGLYYTVDQLSHHVPAHSNMGEHLMAFRSKIAPREKVGQFYRELFSEDTAILLSTCALGGAAARGMGLLAQAWVRSRVARVVIQAGSTEAITTAHLAEKGIDSSLRMLVLPELANISANATTFWAYNKITQDQTQPSHSFAATALDLSILHFGLKPLGGWGFWEGLVGRVFLGGSLMGAAGAVRVELNQFLPDLHLAHEGEEPLEFYNILRGMAFTLGQELMGLGMNSTGKKPVEVAPEVPRPQEVGEVRLEQRRPEVAQRSESGETVEVRPTDEIATSGEAEVRGIAVKKDGPIASLSKIFSRLDRLLWKIHFRITIHLDNVEYTNRVKAAEEILGSKIFHKSGRLIIFDEAYPMYLQRGKQALDRLNLSPKQRDTLLRIIYGIKDFEDTIMPKAGRSFARYINTPEGANSYKILEAVCNIYQKSNIPEATLNILVEVALTRGWLNHEPRLSFLKNEMLPILEAMTKNDWTMEQMSRMLELVLPMAEHLSVPSKVIESGREVEFNIASYLGRMHKSGFNFEEQSWFFDHLARTILDRAEPWILDRNYCDYDNDLYYNVVRDINVWIYYAYRLHLRSREGGVYRRTQSSTDPIGNFLDLIPRIGNQGDLAEANHRVNRGIIPGAVDP